MELIFIGLLIAGLTFSVSRFTRLHPLIVTVLGGLIWAGLGTLLMIAFAPEAWLFMAVVAFVIGVFPSGIGAFLGWLRRTNVEKTSV